MEQACLKESLNIQGNDYFTSCGNMWLMKTFKNKHMKQA